jgi:capsular polysaccharide biosynthesis protein
VNENDQPVDDQDQMATLTPVGSYSLSERIWDYDFTTAEDRPADPGERLVSWKFIKAALRRNAWLWSAIAIAGLFAGIGLNAVIPHGFVASTTLLITPGPFNSNAEIGNDLNVAQSRTVATLALRKLRLHESASSFLGSYTVTQLPSSEMLLITASAPSTSEAVSRANAVAAAFLQFRAGQLEAEQSLMVRSLEHDVSQASQQQGTLGNQIRHLSGRPSSPAHQAALSKLQDELSQATANLNGFRGILNINETSNRVATASAIKDSVVFDTAAPVPHSSLKHRLLYPVVGLVLGLTLGMGIVIVRALTSDGLRMRDDIAHALGAPIKLSTRPVRLMRWLPGYGKRVTAHGTGVQRIAAHLEGVVPAANSRGAAALAVVPVTEAGVAALSLVSVAASHAQRGRRVVLADLCNGAPGARLLGVRKPGIHALSTSDTHLIVAVPDRRDVTPIGPIDPRGGRRTFAGAPGRLDHSSFTENVAKACASADLLLTLAVLDPSLGGEHLSTWAADAVVVVSAGRSSWTKIHAAGEMIRLAGMRLVSAVLIGADKDDETLGVMEPVLTHRNASDG